MMDTTHHAPLLSRAEADDLARARLTEALPALDSLDHFRLMAIDDVGPNWLAVAHRDALAVTAAIDNALAAYGAPSEPD